MSNVRLMLIATVQLLIATFAYADENQDCLTEHELPHGLEVLFEPNCRVAVVTAINPERTVISADFEGWLIEFMRNTVETSEIKISAVKFEGDINLSNLKISLFLNFEDVEILGGADFSSSRSELPLRLKNTKVRGAVNLEDSEFKALYAPSLSVGDNFLGNGMRLDGELYLSGGSFDLHFLLRSARINGNFLLDRAKVNGSLELYSSRFGQQVLLDDTVVGELVNLQSVSIEEMLLARRMRIQFGFEAPTIRVSEQVDISQTRASVADFESAYIGDLLLLREAQFSSFRGKFLTVGSQIDAGGAVLRQEFDVEEANIGSNFLGRGMQIGHLEMRSISISDQLDLSASKIGSIRFSEAVLGANFLARELEVSKDVDVVGSQFGGQILLLSSRIQGLLLIENLRVRGNVFLRESSFENTVSFVYSDVGGSLDLSASSFTHLALAGTTLEGELRFGSLVSKPWSWSGTSRLDLRGVSVGGIEDFPVGWVDDDDVWPSEFLVDGFQFQRLTSSFSDPLSRDMVWYKKFFDRMQFSKQTYDHFADYFDNIGDSVLASDVRFLSADRARNESSNVASKSLAYLNMIFVGYGERLYLAFFWAMGFVFFGFLILRYLCLTCSDHRKLDLLFYSFDRFIPFIELDKSLASSVELTTSIRYYFYLHSIMGYVVGVFVAAAIAGLAK